MINPGNTRTFTLTEEQVADVIDSLLYYADELHDKALEISDPDEIARLNKHENELHFIADILDADDEITREGRAMAQGGLI